MALPLGASQEKGQAARKEGQARLAPRRTGRLALALAFFLAIASACSSARAGQQGLVTLRIAGSTSMTAVLSDLAASYQAGHPNVVVDIRAGDSASGLIALQAGQAEAAAISWHPKEASVPAGLRAVPVARDAIAIIVHPSNPVRGLTLLQIKAIYQGEMLTWDALGGTALVPAIISREDGSGTRAAFESLAVGGERVTLNALVMPSSAAVVGYVATHPAAIGYVTSAALTDTLRALDVEGAQPTAANVRGGAYHLSRVLYLYVPAPTPAATQAFVDFILSPAGQALVAQHHIALR
jgi:phosphate transport system substrate-binding protein